MIIELKFSAEVNNLILAGGHIFYDEYEVIHDDKYKHDKYNYNRCHIKCENGCESFVIIDSSIDVNDIDNFFDYQRWSLVYNRPRTCHGLIIERVLL